MVDGVLELTSTQGTNPNTTSGYIGIGSDDQRNRIKIFEIFISKMVLDEAGDGDPVAAKERLQAIENVPLLDLTEEAFSLADRLVKLHAIPKEYPEDALHIAVAAVNGMDFLLT
ncbi:type II toxin-antitoxin system VapC family toxin [Deltaproteobacteria bacterium TL4]